MSRVSVDYTVLLGKNPTVARALRCFLAAR